MEKFDILFNSQIIFLSFLFIFTKNIDFITLQIIKLVKFRNSLFFYAKLNI